jgi:NAD(P)-dependent dehydrogenase (short-subunit alcohol dehydrogenase family)
MPGGSRWTATDIPDQSGRLIVVTGANSGLGLETTRELARAGATVVIACRDAAKGHGAAESVRRDVGAAALEVRSLDLADLDSVRRFASELAADHPSVDVLINNAGVMAPPRRRTADGFESQFGTNHLGHFALSGLLLDQLLASPQGGRVVTVSSGAHRIPGAIKFADPQFERGYSPWRSYGQSKLANLMFCFELARRAAQAGAPLVSLAAHPGYARTNLQVAGPRFWEAAMMRVTNLLFAQSAAMGALPSLYAATLPDLPGGTFVGPDGMGEQRGHPKVVAAAEKAYDEDAWRRLWELSEELTGVVYRWPTS